MLTQNAKELMEKQQYRIVGNHSAVKICGWTKNMIKGHGGCYKLKFYGIMSHQCLQMTTSISCANRCVFCWRDYKAPVSKDWIWDVDSPEFILEGSLHAQKKLLEGFKGNHEANRQAVLASDEVKHVALSLTGEPIMYPKLNELLQLFNERKISTFLVTNAQHPEQIKNLAPITQLYLSIDAPNKALLKEIDKPLYPDFWQRFQDSLKYTAQKKQRTCIRLTLIKGLNDIEPENYAAIIKKADVDFIEVKGYMHIGASRGLLERKNMPEHSQVVDFAKKLTPFLEEYELISEHKPSRVVLFAKKKYKKEDGWHTWIDFSKDPSDEDNMAKTPEQFIGLKYQENAMVNGRSSYLRENDAETGYIAVCEKGDESKLE